MAAKVAFIGAGSIGFTRMLMSDILTVPELAETQFAFHDIDARNLSMVAQLAQRDVKAYGAGATVTATADRRRALEGADYVINCTRIGGLDAFKLDVEIPLKYGVDQCVGDTLCAGGIMYGQRNIPQILAFCKDIREVAAADALFLNYANPMAINTWAAIAYGGVQTLGLCHGVQFTHYQIAEAIQHQVNKGKAPKSKGYRYVPRDEVSITAAGINHQTWFIKVDYRGKDWTGRLLEALENHPQISQTEKVRIDMTRRFGYYSTESNGHLSEYVPWYRKRTKDIRKWIHMGNWIDGETGGYLRVCTEGRNWFKADFKNWLKEEPQKPSLDLRSVEHAAYIIESIETGRVYRGHFNVQNSGCIGNLPDDAIVEVPAYVDEHGISVPPVGDLPLGCAAVCNASISVQRLAMEAAVHGDVDLLKQSMMMDPLVGAVCDPIEISQMVDEMLIAQARWLPNYKRSLAATRTRFRAAKKTGARTTKDAARLKTKTIAEMKQDRAAARRQAATADKSSQTKPKRKKS